MIAAQLDLTVTRGITFVGFVLICLDGVGGNPVDLTGYTPFAEVRKKPGAAVVRDLAPELSDAAAGEVTIPEISDEDTMGLTKGSYHWDFVLQSAAGKRFGPYVAGLFVIKNINTQPTV